MKFVLSRDRKFPEACALIKDYTQKHIDRALKLQAENNDTKNQRKVILINELAQETTDPSDLCSQLLNVFFAGRDTPAVALTNIFFLLARHPQIWKKCRTEVDGLQAEDLTFERLKSLRYIQHVINEGKNAGQNSTQRLLRLPSYASPTTCRLPITKLSSTLNSTHWRWSRWNTTCLHRTRRHNRNQFFHSPPRPTHLRTRP
jgi:hypothetical protein